MHVYAEAAEGYALDAIDFAQAAVYEAEFAVLEALSARTAVDAMASGKGTESHFSAPRAPR